MTQNQPSLRGDGALYSECSFKRNRDENSFRDDRSGNDTIGLAAARTGMLAAVGRKPSFL